MVFRYFVLVFCVYVFLCLANLKGAEAPLFIRCLQTIQRFLLQQLPLQLREQEI